MLKFKRISSTVRYEKVLDFSREIDIVSLKGYYMKTSEIISHRNIPLYIMELEEVTRIYYLTVSASDWVTNNLDYNIDDKIIMLSEEFMYKFDLVRVIPEGGIQPNDSFLRIMLKQVPENAKLYSIEEELYGEDLEKDNE